MKQKFQIALVLITMVVVLWSCGPGMSIAHKAFLDLTNQFAHTSE